MPLFSSNAAKNMSELAMGVYLNKALGGTGSRKALQKIVNSNAELKKTINATPGWERAVKAAKNILNVEKKQVEEAQKKRQLPLGNVNPHTNGLTNAQKKKMANGPPVIYEKDPSAPEAAPAAAPTAEATAAPAAAAPGTRAGRLSLEGGYKHSRRHRKTRSKKTRKSKHKNSRKTRGRKH